MSGVARDAAFRPAAKRPVRDADQGKGSGETGRFPQRSKLRPPVTLSGESFEGSPKGGCWSPGATVASVVRKTGGGRLSDGHALLDCGHLGRLRKKERKE